MAELNIVAAWGTHTNLKDTVEVVLYQAMISCNDLFANLNNPEQTLCKLKSRNLWLNVCRKSEVADQCSFAGLQPEGSSEYPSVCTVSPKGNRIWPSSHTPVPTSGAGAAWEGSM